MEYKNLKIKTHSKPKSSTQPLIEDTSIFFSPIGALKIKILNETLDTIQQIHPPRKLTPFKTFKNFKLIFPKNSTAGFRPSALHKEVSHQLRAYFKRKLKKFDLPLSQKKRPLNESVKNALLNIPFGHTTTYSKLAQDIRKPRAFRAVGNVCARNSLIIVVPCHRVLRKDQSLGGFSIGIATKKKLLEHEGFL